MKKKTLSIQDDRVYQELEKFINNYNEANPRKKVTQSGVMELAIHKLLKSKQHKFATTYDTIGMTTLDMADYEDLTDFNFEDGFEDPGPEIIKSGPEIPEKTEAPGNEVEKTESKMSMKDETKQIIHNIMVSHKTNVITPEMFRAEMSRQFGHGSDKAFNNRWNLATGVFLQVFKGKYVADEMHFFEEYDRLEAMNKPKGFQESKIGPADNIGSMKRL
jgi:hypothetical protein